MSKDTLEVVYEFIRDYIQEHGSSPSQREIGEACHLGHSTVIRYLDRLQLNRRVGYRPGKARSIHLLPPSETDSIED